MKRIFYLGLMMVAMAVAMSSCSSADTPGKALGKYLTALQNGDYDTFVDGIAFKEGTNADKAKEQREGFKSLLKEKGMKEFDKKGGLKSYKILSEEISEDGNSATVKFKQVYGDGSEDDNEQKMVKRDGKWLMDINK